MNTSESAHAQALTVKKDIRLILHSSIKALVTVVIYAAPDGGFHGEYVHAEHRIGNRITRIRPSVKTCYC